MNEHDTGRRALLKAALLLVALHNLPTLFSRYSVLGGFPEWH